eukprot:356919-Chlamydomonas_euryale.AAC.2
MGCGALSCRHEFQTRLADANPRVAAALAAAGAEAAAWRDASERYGTADDARGTRGGGGVGSEEPVRDPPCVSRKCGGLAWRDAVDETCSCATECCNAFNPYVSGRCVERWRGGTGAVAIQAAGVDFPGSSIHFRTFPASAFSLAATSQIS